MKKKKVYLTLQNGVSFQGYRFGGDGELSGELVFSTGMVGYVETLTDPTNFGKIIVQTFPLIGNYGIMRADMESEKAWASAFIVREYCENPSNFRMEGDLDTFLREEGVVGIYGIDTRQLTKILREEGEMYARISNKPLSAEDVNVSFEDVTAKRWTPSTEIKTHGDSNAKYKIAFWNFGAKKSTICNLVQQDAQVIDIPATATAEDIMAINPNGIVISDGPGDPAENQAAIAELKKLFGKKPILGIGLGHQMLALALGAKTSKQKHGHHGGNQPVKSVEEGRVYISTQNHSYTVLTDSIRQGTVSFINVNDGTCEGIDYSDNNAFTIQFTPESCSNGNLENPLYKKFFAMMDKEKENA